MQARLDAVEVSAEQQHPGIADAQHGPVADQVVGEGLDPAAQDGLLPALPQSRHGDFDHVCGSLEILGGQRVPDSDGLLAVLLMPHARPPMQVWHPVVLLVEQTGLQHVCEEVVIAIPPTAIIKRDQEQVASVQCVQHRLPTRPAGDRITERAAQPVQDAGLQQEIPDLLGLALQDLLGQVVDDVTVVPGEAGDELGDVVSPLDRQCCQLERGDPSFGAPLQGCHLLCRQGQPIVSLR
jgi:hypothetical protein